MAEKRIESNPKPPFFTRSIIDEAREQMRAIMLEKEAETILSDVLEDENITNWDIQCYESDDILN